jgi:hypothetical protein
VLGSIPGVRPAKRLAVTTYRQLHPLRPPIESPALVARMLVAPNDDVFITGNGFAAHCRYVLNYDVLRVNDEVENNWWFCNPEFLEYFFRHLARRRSSSFSRTTATSTARSGVGSSGGLAGPN